MSDNSYLWGFLSTSDDILIVDSFTKADSVINNPKYKTILCSISGGSDSDVMLDLITKVDRAKKVKYIWFDTGLEYQATKDHLLFLEAKYAVNIERERAIKPIPLSCKEYGQPFLSKFASEQISRLQSHGFKWEDRSFEELLEEYPKCKSAVKWWTNQYTKENGFERPSHFDIGYNKYLKSFIMHNPPTFKISSKCCKYAKKGVGKHLAKKYNADLQLIGVRRAEGGIRATAYSNCFTASEDSYDNYRPVFWYTDDTKKEYEEKFGVTHSRCYTEYGFRRTGYACCPYGNKNLDHELRVVEKYEPKLYKAVNNIFKDSYEYTREYRKFCEMMKAKEDKKQIDGQMSIADFLGA